MKILILCDMVPPAFGPRMGYLCKYMRRAGWEPVVVTEQIDDSTFSFLKGETPVTYVNFFHSKGKILQKLEWICIFILDYFFHYKDKKMAKAASRLLEEGEYAGILCSSYRTFPLPAAQYIAEKYHLPLVIDLRDIVEQYASNEYIAHNFRTFSWLDRKITETFRHKLLRDRNNALRKADQVTTISPWHVEKLQAYNPNTELVYNGYDPELFYPEQHRTSQFVITYTGRLISLATRDPRLLFEAVSRLDREKLIDPDQFRIQWYVDAGSKAIIMQAATAYPVARYMDFFDYVPASEIPGVLNRSSILLQLANTFASDGPKGFMTTKLFESMAVGKPLLCVKSDESCLEATIRNTRSGLAARTAEEAFRFILHHYQFWQDNGYTHINTDKEAVERFSRKKQAEQFMRIFTRLNSK